MSEERVASPDGPPAHVVLRGWSQVCRSPNLSDRRIRAGLRRGREGKIGQVRWQSLDQYR